MKKASSIPIKVREILEVDPFMEKCIYNLIDRGHECKNEFGGAVVPEWEHAWIYAGRQINEIWSIVPCCWYHHRGGGLNKHFNQYISLLRATPQQLEKYPRIDWGQKHLFFESKFGKMNIA